MKIYSINSQANYQYNGSNKCKNPNFKSGDPFLLATATTSLIAGGAGIVALIKTAIDIDEDMRKEEQEYETNNYRYNSQLNRIHNSSSQRNFTIINYINNYINILTNKH